METDEDGARSRHGPPRFLIAGLALGALVGGASMLYQQDLMGIPVLMVGFVVAGVAIGMGDSRRDTA